MLNFTRRDKSLADHLNRALGDLTLIQVRPALLAEYKAKRRAAGGAAKTINDELTLLGHAYKLATKEWEWVTDNPVQRITKEKVRNQMERWATRLVQTGVDLYMVQKLGRRKTITMGMRYARHSPESLRPGAEALGRVVRWDEKGHDRKQPGRCGAFLSRQEQSDGG